MNVLLEVKGNDMDIDGVIDTVEMFVGEGKVIEAEGYDLAVVVLDADNMTIDETIDHLSDVLGDIGVVLDCDGKKTKFVLDFLCHDGTPSLEVREMMVRYGFVSEPSMSTLNIKNSTVMTYLGVATEDDLTTICDALENSENITIVMTNLEEQ